MRFNHNKKRNTAFLFETLVKELTKSVINNNLDKKHQIVKIIKEFFNEKEILGKELKLYKSIADCYSVTPRVAEKVLAETKKQYINLDKKQIFNRQSVLIKEINKNISKEVFSNFVPQYKTYATLCQIVSEGLDPQDRVLLEEAVINRMTLTPQKKVKKQVPLDMLSYKTFVNKFNEKYGDLNENQKTLLNKYIASFADNGLEFKIFLNEEVSRLRGEIGKAMVQEDVQNDTIVVEKLEKVLSLIKDFQSEKINSKLLEKILKIQTLAKEVL
tara:strand:+ start:40770 stop:41585 length:816 start_codon:yes stop_codon:yes gene_type:complete